MADDKVRMKTFWAELKIGRSALAESLRMASEWIQASREDVDVYSVDVDGDTVDVYYRKYKKNQAF